MNIEANEKNLQEMDLANVEIENLRKEAVSGMATVIHAASMAMVSETVNLLSWLLGVYGGTWIVLISVFRNEMSYDPIINFSAKLLLLATLLGMGARVLVYNLKSLLSFQEKQESMKIIEKKADYIIDHLIDNTDISQEEKFKIFVDIFKEITGKMFGKGFLGKTMETYSEYLINRAQNRGSGSNKHTQMSRSTLFAISIDRIVLVSLSLYCNAILVLILNGVIF